jgi:hypothetical protein
MTNKISPEDKVYPDSENYGLTKREYFACQVFIGLLANTYKKSKTYRELAEVAVNQADELINALNEDQ